MSVFHCGFSIFMVMRRAGDKTYSNTYSTDSRQQDTKEMWKNSLKIPSSTPFTFSNTYFIQLVQIKG